MNPGGLTSLRRGGAAISPQSTQVGVMGTADNADLRSGELVVEQLKARVTKLD